MPTTTWAGSMPMPTVTDSCIARTSSSAIPIIARVKERRRLTVAPSAASSVCCASFSRNRATSMTARRPAPRGMEATPPSAAAAWRANSSQAPMRWSPASGEASSVPRPLCAASDSSASAAADSAPILSDSPPARRAANRATNGVSSQTASGAGRRSAEQSGQRGQPVATNPVQFANHAVLHRHRGNGDRYAAKGADREALDSRALCMAR